ARLLLTCPPRQARRWTEAGIDPDLEAKLARLVDRLYKLQPTTGDDGEPRPVLLRLDAAAQAAWETYYNTHAVEQAELTGDLAAAWSKLEEYAARLTLVIHCARWAADDTGTDDARTGMKGMHKDMVDTASMNAGITLAQWFKHEARRVYAMLD